MNRVVYPTGNWFLSIAFDSIQPPDMQIYKGIESIPYKLLYGQDPTSNSYKKAKRGDVQIGGAV
jgi:hypothetical protein